MVSDIKSVKIKAEAKPSDTSATMPPNQIDIVFKPSFIFLFYTPDRLNRVLCITLSGVYVTSCIFFWHR